MPVVLHNEEAVLDVLSHHPELLLALPDLPLGNDPPGNVLQDDGEAFPPVFKHGRHGFLPEEPFLLTFETEGDLVVVFCRSGGERLEQFMHVDIRGTDVEEAFPMVFCRDRCSSPRKLLLISTMRESASSTMISSRGTTEHGRERDSLERVYTLAMPYVLMSTGRR